MLRRAVTSGLFCALALLACAARAEACACTRAGSPCDALGGAAAVFVGTVTNVIEGERRTKPGGALEFKPRLVTFAVGQPLFGAAGAEVVVATGIGGGDCGYKFERGASYLVYAYPGENGSHLYTSVCTRTRPAARADEDLWYLRGVAAAPTTATVSGRVERKLPYPGPDGFRGNVPAAGLTLTAEAGGQTREVRVDGEGRYRVSGLAPGEVRLRLGLPEKTTTYKPERLLKVAAGGCAAEDFYVKDDGRVGGRVFDSEGQPLAGAGVVIVSAGGDMEMSDGIRAETDAEGRYQLTGIPAGRYLLGINIRGLPRSIEPAELPADHVCTNCFQLVEFLRAEALASAYPRFFYPGVLQVGRAEVLYLSPGQELRDIDLRLPPRREEGVVRGKVVWADGTPMPREEVRYREVTYEDLRGFDLGVRTDERGEFSFKGYRGGRYFVRVISNAPARRPAGHPWPWEMTYPLTVTINNPVETITLVVTKLK